MRNLTPKVVYTISELLRLLVILALAGLFAFLLYAFSEIATNNSTVIIYDNDNCKQMSASDTMIILRCNRESPGRD